MPANSSINATTPASTTSAQNATIPKAIREIPLIETGLAHATHGQQSMTATRAERQNPVQRWAGCIMDVCNHKPVELRSHPVNGVEAPFLLFRSKARLRAL